MATATKRGRKGRRRTRSRRRHRSHHLGARELVSSALPELVAAFGERGLLVYASAVAFQILSAIVPFVLFGLGLIGFLNATSVWTQDIAPHIRPNLSAAGWTVIDNTAMKVLTQKQVFWVTGGFAFAIWQISGAVRVIMRGLDTIYETRDKRSGCERTLISLALAVAVSALILAAIAVVWLGPLVYGGVGGAPAVLLFAVRWVLAAVLLGLAVGLIDRFAPDSRQPVGWVSFGTGLMVGAWIVASIVFGLYIKFLASPGSLFGALATVVILIAYIYLSTVVFFAGAQADAIIRRRVEGNAQGR